MSTLIKKESRKATLEISFETYRRKVLGCWLGKAVGGTLGGPYEGEDGPFSLTFYDPVPDRMLPNDDLDLQIVWMEAIRRHGLPIHRRLLAEAWQQHVHMFWGEYGVGMRNMAQGIWPPVSGQYDNWWTDGMGSAIRTESWACLAPGDPQLACTLAREDSCVDHAGEGLWATMFLAALESAAFTETDQETLLNIAAGMIPAESRVARAIADTRRWWSELGDWMAVRQRILDRYEHPNFTDVPQNLAFIVLGWLAGQGNFSDAICIAVNCGKDTDCTGATLGALLGILSPDGIDEKWLKPIGHDLVLSVPIINMHSVRTLDEFTDQTAALALHVLDYYLSPIQLINPPAFEKERANIHAPRFAKPDLLMLPKDAVATESLVTAEPLPVFVTYAPQVGFLPEQTLNMKVRVANPTDKRAEGWLRVHVPDGWAVAQSIYPMQIDAGQSQSVDLAVTAPSADIIRVARNPLDLDLTVNGLSWRVTAGLPMSTPWLVWPHEGQDRPVPPMNLEPTEYLGHYLPLPDGPCAFLAELKQSMGPARFVIQAPRHTRVWLDDELIIEHDGSYIGFPALHLFRETGKDVECGRKWHRLTVAVGDGKGGELFIGTGTTHVEWSRTIEWRQPGP